MKEWSSIIASEWSSLGLGTSPIYFNFYQLFLW
jgi:hypothetical protein